MRYTNVLTDKYILLNHTVTVVQALHGLHLDIYTTLNNGTNIASQNDTTSDCGVLVGKGIDNIFTIWMEQGVPDTYKVVIGSRVIFHNVDINDPLTYNFSFIEKFDVSRLS